MKKLIFFLLFLISYSNSIAQNAEENTQKPEIVLVDEAKSCQVIGFVKNAQSKQSIANVSVRLIPMKGNDQQGTTTDSEGKYTFQLKDNGDYLLYFVKEYHFTQTKNISNKKNDCLEPIIVNVNLGKIGK